MLETQIAWLISSFVVMGPVNFVLSSCTDAMTFSYTQSEVGKDRNCMQIINLPSFGRCFFYVVQHVRWQLVLATEYFYH